MIKHINKLFVLTFLGVLLLGLGKTLLLPKDINAYENRYANKLPAVTAAGFADKTLQSGVEAALMDQFPMAEAAKKVLNSSAMGFKMHMVGTYLSDMFREQYIRLGNYSLFGGVHYVFEPIYYDYTKEKFDERIKNLNAVIEALPETDFYAYYIEKDTDIDFTSNEKMGVGNRVLSQLKLPEEKKAIFTVDNFQQFDREFFRTDTHWNYLGAYRGYCEVLELLFPEERPLQPMDTRLVCQSFSGNKADTSGAQGIWNEAFYAYAFDFPSMEYCINGEPAEDYGKQNQYGLETTSYGGYYGSDAGEVIFHNPAGNGERLLFLGESFDNAILKLIASHVSALYSVDLRNYEAKLGRPFDLEQYLTENDIDRVVLIGNMDFYRDGSFDLGVKDGIQ